MIKQSQAWFIQRIGKEVMASSKRDTGTVILIKDEEHAKLLSITMQVEQGYVFADLQKEPTPAGIPIEPFTYYKTADNTRAYLVADVADPELHLSVPAGAGRVWLVEWGKSRTEALRYKLDDFRAWIAHGKMVPFTPHLA